MGAVGLPRVASVTDDRDRDHESDERAADPARAVAFVVLLPVIIVAAVVLAVVCLACAAERGIRRWVR